jgi:hypothetical protein
MSEQVRSSTMTTDVTGNYKLRAATRMVAQAYYDPRAAQTYDRFEVFNATYFANELPWPLIVLSLTPHGHLLGLTPYVVAARDMGQHRSRPGVRRPARTAPSER